MNNIFNLNLGSLSKIGEIKTCKTFANLANAA